jgi:hypothetical protein
MSKTIEFRKRDQKHLPDPLATKPLEDKFKPSGEIRAKFVETSNGPFLRFTQMKRNRKSALQRFVTMA